MTVFEGKDGVDRFRAIALKSALKLYAATGIKANRAYTPKNMMTTAKAITGKTFKARDYAGAIKALEEYLA